MKNSLIGALVLVMTIGIYSCEPTNPYNYGPVYDVEGNLTADSLSIAGYLDTAKMDSLYRIYDPSGVVIIVQEEGLGSRPNYNTSVYTNYVGKLMDGFVFDTNIQSVAEANDLHEDGDEYRPFQFLVTTLQNSTQSGAIPGFSFGFKPLRSGSKATLVIPSVWGYRDQVKTNIPENSILVFEVDFLGMD
ncbi:hypothetical protein GCM10007049_08590 [Echinicola pacifica]|uniref:Peptidyl-prolyl cis-trans isomerase n=1 Tax=Echinicola pacifica TaxID=346377 RepID=A0A918UL88_9BACT|nr:FKBP-type peptidyl-prolyl cis-trans isomerase [Echinicola pacifica]GGZ18626.1 hypothetical protein GCM10007049_08590 [Echinicola pacifica]